MHDECDEDRLASAEHLTGFDAGRAAQAFRAIACDDGVGDEVRLAAAQQLTALGSVHAVEACVAIAGDDGVGDEVRLSAAELLATLGHRSAHATRIGWAAADHRQATGPEDATAWRH